MLLLRTNCGGGVLEFNVPLTTRSWRRHLGLQSHPKDWRSRGSNWGPLDCKASMLTTAPRPLLEEQIVFSMIQVRWVFDVKRYFSKNICYLCSLELPQSITIYMSHIMTKPVYAICEQQRHRSACATVQSDQ